MLDDAGTNMEQDMGFEDLPSQLMVAISNAWLDPALERPIIEAMPLMNGLLGKVESAHRELTQAMRARTSTSNELLSIRKAQAAADMTHDRKARGIFTVLTAFAQLADETDTAQRYLRLRDLLFPAGLRTIAIPYQEEIAAVESLQRRLTDDDWALLKSLPLPQDASLHDSLMRLIEAGEELRQLEQARADLELRRESGLNDAQSAEVTAARQRWLKTARALMTTADLEDLDAGQRQRLFGRLKERAARPATGAKAARPAVDVRRDAAESTFE